MHERLTGQQRLSQIQREASLLENMTTAVVMLGSSLQVKYMNPAAEVLFAVSEQRSHNLSITELVSRSGALNSRLLEAMETGQPYTRREKDLECHDGRRLLLDYTATPVEEGILLEFQQLDRLKKISREEALKTNRETAKNLIRGMAHEIKNPLGGIRGAAQLLARELPDPEMKDFTDIIIGEADRLRNLVDRMLGPLNPPRLEPVNIHAVLEHVRQLVLAETKGKLQILQDYDPSVPEVSGDNEQLIQVVLNVVRNACQAISGSMPLNQGKVTLRTRIRRQFTIESRIHRLICQLDICDNGPGIPEDMQESIFYPMISGRAEGSGLGLSIAQSIMGQHQGLIECSSEPGNTTFTLYLPFEQISAGEPNEQH
ncbi:nitrogen regulation protein NR(II) [Spongorhabdus nitratireducens]